jgi:hypothetical protein
MNILTPHINRLCTPRDPDLTQKDKRKLHIRILENFGYMQIPKAEQDKAKAGDGK